MLRRIDEVGRIVIPQELRLSLGIYSGDTLDLSEKEGSLVINKVENCICPKCQKKLSEVENENNS